MNVSDIAREMARDLGPLITAQRTAVARAHAELDELDQHLATLEESLAFGEPEPDLCLATGGERDDQLRLRTELPMPANARVPVLTHLR
jgi:hypothetical protein